jgi:hypothetical protein
MRMSPKNLYEYEYEDENEDEKFIIILALGRRVSRYRFLS